MPISAWVMLIIASLILYGGLIWCIVIAVKKNSLQRKERDRNKT